MNIQDILKQSPYFDDYNPSKGFSRIVALPGRVEQAREFTQLQSMLLDFMKRLGDVTLKEGSVVQGCEVAITGNTAKVTAGRVYLGGIIREVPESSVSITGVGNETIGVKLIQQIITEAEDTSLVDPAQGYDNSGLPGAHRVKETVEVCSNEQESTVIFRLLDGSLITNDIRPELDTINDMLARRTYDEVGNYKVEGLTITDMAQVSEDGTQLRLAIDGGKAYVKGYAIIKPTSTSLWVDKSLDFKTIIAEPKVYQTGTNKYKLNNSPVKSVNQLTAVVTTTKTITRGNVSGGADMLPLTPVVDITSVTAGAITYTKGVDFQVNGDSIDWSLSGAEPAIGSSYNITWKYNKLMKIGIDFDLTSDSTGDYIDFTNSQANSGDIPTASSTMTIDYDFYLCRTDLIVMDRYGNISAIKGQANIKSLVATPSYNDTEFFRLGVVTYPANGNTPEINNNAISRMPIEKIYALMNRIEDLEYNDAVNDLDNTVLETEPATELKGVLTDGFLNYNKVDLNHILWNCAFDLTENSATLPFTAQSFKLTLANIAQNTGYDAKLYHKNILATNNEVVLLAQELATESVLINPYGVYIKNAIMRLTPSASTIIGEVRYLDGGVQNIVNSITNPTVYNGTYWRERDRQNLLRQGYTQQGSNLVSSSSTSSSSSNSYTTTSTKERLLTYVPQETVQVQVQNFLPFADNLVLTFDGKVVNAVPLTATYKGTQDGTLKADSTGTVLGSFTIPAGVLTGTREVVLSNANHNASGTVGAATGDLDPANIKASTTFITPGAVMDTEVVRHTVVTTNIVTTSTVIRKATDPVAQSFSFDKDQFISKVGVFFASKDPVNNVVVEIRNMENGYPGDKQYAVKVLTPAQITASPKGTAETVVVFDDPVFCEANEQYCVIIGSDSNVASVFVANLGDKDVNTGAYVTKQAYSIGTLFTSSNAITWTAQQAKDLKLKVYGPQFKATACVVFDEININANRLNLSAMSMLPNGTACEWEYRINGGTTWNAIPPYVDIFLSQVATKVQIRAKFTGSSNASPVLSLEGVVLNTYLNKTSGTYITRNVEMSQVYTTIKQVVDLYLPSGATATVKYCWDKDGITEANWKTPSQSSVVAVSAEYSRYTFTSTVPVGTNVKDFRARIDFSTTTPTIQPKAKNFMNILK